MTLSIQTHQLSKIYGNRPAVNDLTLEVRQGEVFGFLGPNGAGKTTSIKMLLSLVEPTSGSAELLGRPLDDRSIRARIGFLPEHFRFHDWLTAGEFLHLHGELYDMNRSARQVRIATLLERVNLTPFAHKQLRTFSKGMLQRVGLAQALMNHPSLVFLDEPTSGLDPVGRLLVRDIIAELSKEGATVFLNSHLLSEVEITCDRAAFIKNGQVIRTVGLKEFGAAEARVSIKASDLSAETLNGLERFGKMLETGTEKRVEQTPRTILLALAPGASLPELTAYLVHCGAQVYAITPQHTSLEDLFLQIIGTDGGL